MNLSRLILLSCSVSLIGLIGLCKFAPAEDQTGGATVGETSGRWQERAAQSARILSQVKWSPIAETMPERRGGYFEKGKQYTGVPYSSVKSVGRCIGFDISLRTFLAAVENPHSVLYTKNLKGKVSNAACYYGAVCSTYTSYALGCGIPEVSRRYGPHVSQGVIQVESQSAQLAEVGDIIYTPYTTVSSGSHVEIVTAVKRNDQGEVTSVRVEESRPLTTKTTDYTPAKFNAHLAARNKQLLRVIDREAWRVDNRAESFLFPNPEADAESPEINRTLLLDLGDWVPYQKGEVVKFHVMDRDKQGVKSLVIERNGELVEEIPLEGLGIIERTFEQTGDYTAHVVRPDDSKSQACQFAVCDLTLDLPTGSVSLDKEWEVKFSSENIHLIAVHLWNESDSYGRHSLFLTDEQRRQGGVKIPAETMEKPGSLQVWLIGEHPLGRLKLKKNIPLVQ